jgi:peptidoglycan/xylan/chitin deacetylase (PgdA/CDA1 family)
MLVECSPLHNIEKRSPLLTRREVLFAGAAWAVGVPRTPSLVDELTSLLDFGSEDSPPDRGESLPPGMAPRSREVPTNQDFDYGRHLFLTFDDGPLPCTGRILDLLSETRHKATFFVVGRNLTNPKLRDFAVRALREGHDMGNHSFSHPDFSRISAKRAEREIVTTHALIEQVVQEAGVDRQRQNRFFRFPYGVSGSWLNHRACRKVLEALDYRVAWWDVDTHDWRMELAWFPRPLRKVVAALTKARPHDVVLLHDRSKTARCLPQLMVVLETHGLLSLPLSRYEQLPAVPLEPDPTPDICSDGDPLQRDPMLQFFEDVLQQVAPWTNTREHSAEYSPGLPTRSILR